MALFRKEKKDEGIDYSKKGWFEKAKPLADAGDPEVQFMTGISIFDDGNMHDKLPLAMKYLHRSAESGYEPALGTLSRLYLTGLRGTEIYQDLEKATDYSSRAPGDSASKYTRAMLILMKRVDGTPEEAASLFLEAADAGIAEARLYSAFIYASDLTGDRDPAKAVEILIPGIKIKKIKKRCTGYINSLKKNPDGDVRLDIDVHTRNGNRKVNVISCGAPKE